MNGMPAPPASAGRWNAQYPSAFACALHLPDQRRIGRAADLQLPATRRALERVDVLLHEPAYAVTEVLDLFGDGEVHGARDDRRTLLRELRQGGLLLRDAQEVCEMAQAIRLAHESDQLAALDHG